MSLTCDFKTFSCAGEKINSIETLGFEKLNPKDILGGSTISDSADIFVEVLNNRATTAQSNVVLCNAALAINTINPQKSFADCFYEAKESLIAKKALKSFETLVAN